MLDSKAHYFLRAHALIDYDSCDVVESRIGTVLSVLALLIDQLEMRKRGGEVRGLLYRSDHMVAHCAFVTRDVYLLNRIVSAPVGVDGVPKERRQRMQVVSDGTTDHQLRRNYAEGR